MGKKSANLKDISLFKDRYMLLHIRHVKDIVVAGELPTGLSLRLGAEKRTFKYLYRAKIRNFLYV